MSDKLRAANQRLINWLKSGPSTKEDTLCNLKSYLEAAGSKKRISNGLTFSFRDPIMITPEKEKGQSETFKRVRLDVKLDEQAQRPAEKIGGVLLAYGQNSFCACGHYLKVDSDDYTTFIQDTEDDPSLSVDGKFAHDDRDVFYPKIIEAVRDVRFVQISCGGGPHTACVSTDGKCYTFGSGESGQLGRGSAYLTVEDEFIPTPVKGLLEREFIMMVSCGTYHTAYLTKKGEVYLSGIYRSISEAIGLTPTERKSITPVLAMAFRASDPVVKIVSGSDHTLALTQNREVYSFGCGETGVLGRDNCKEPSQSLLPQPVCRTWPASEKVIDVFAGHFASFLLTDKGNTYAFGINQGGQLGLDRASPPTPNDMYAMPTKISFFAQDRRVKHIVGGEQHTIFVCENGKVYCAGQGVYGRLGLGNQHDSIEPFDPMSLSRDARSEAAAPNSTKNNLNPVLNVERAIMGAASLVSSACITSDNSLYTWGSGASFLLGNANEDDDQLVPVKVTQGDHLQFKRLLQIAMGPDQLVLLAEPF